MGEARVVADDARSQAVDSPTDMVLRGAKLFALHNRRGDPYQIMVSAPPTRKGSERYPIIYMLDANASFLTMAENVRLRSERPELSNVGPGIVVGIGYPTTGAFDMERRTYDYTPPSERIDLPERPDGSAWPASGGADAFLDFIEGTLKPTIEGLYPVDTARQAIFGHSFGGLFVLHALFTRPDSFSTFVAASPSIWWNDRFVLSEERTFARSAATHPGRRRLLITVGDAEQDAGGAQSDNALVRHHAEFKRKNRMVDSARDLTQRLSDLASARLHVRFHAFAGEDHISVLPAAISRAIGFAFATDEDGRR